MIPKPTMNDPRSICVAHPTGEQPEEKTRPSARTLEAQLALRTEELKRANQELDAFAHSVSHDLRAPLRAISCFGQFLTAEYGATFDERGRGYLRRVMEATALMNGLIDDLLQFARASRAEVRRRPLDLSVLARQIADMLQQAAPQRRVEFTCLAGLRVSGDERLIRLALGNLLGNAWKYTGKISEPRVEMGRMERDDGPVFFVRDNGAGFDARYADRLFGLFQRLHSAADFEGTGIGLATAQRIIHRHGGKIWAESKLNEGATFYFTLPDVGESDLGRQNPCAPATNP